MSGPYVELHARSAFSFLQGASAPEDLVSACAELGIPAMALLDRDGVYGAPRFHMAAKKTGMRARRSRSSPTRASAGWWRSRWTAWPKTDSLPSIMQVLNFYSSIFADELLRGRKTATIRLGDKSGKYRKNQAVLVTIGYQHSPREMNNAIRTA